MSLSEFSNEDLEQELENRKRANLTAALLETFTTGYGMFNTGPRVYKRIADVLHTEDLQKLIYELRFNKTRENNNIGAPYFVELDEYKFKVELPEER